VPATKPTSPFGTEREAKEHLIARISAEATQQGIELKEIERKMLYFTETGWTLPNIMDANAEFERDYDNDEYESKIAGIVRSIETKNTEIGGEEQSLWDDAVVKVSEGDHYLLVLIGLGRSAPVRELSNWLPTFDSRKDRPPRDLLRLVVVGIVVAVAMFAAAVISAVFKK
jgi:hypothetical protein